MFEELFGGLENFLGAWKSFLLFRSKIYSKCAQFFIYKISGVDPDRIRIQQSLDLDPDL
jgi:hypothetical protein